MYCFTEFHFFKKKKYKGPFSILSGTAKAINSVLHQDSKRYSSIVERSL